MLAPELSLRFRTNATYIIVCGARVIGTRDLNHRSNATMLFFRLAIDWLYTQFGSISMRIEHVNKAFFNRAAQLATLKASILFFVLNVFGNPSVVASSVEYELKAAFIARFIDFIEWPQTSSPLANFRFCVYGQDPFGATLDELARITPMNNKPVTIIRTRSPRHIQACDLLFISSKEKRSVPALLRKIEDLPVLTIGDTEGFSKLGVIINFFIEQDTQRFEINHQAAIQQRIKISSKLLKLSRINEQAP